MKIKISDIRKIVKESLNNENYTHFAIHIGKNKIVAGWDYSDLDNQSIKEYTKIDLKDQYPNKKLSEFKIVSKNRLKIDPSNLDNWYKENDLNEGYNEETYYMFFQNLEQIKNQCEELLSMDKMQIDNILKSGHDWAADHISTSKDDVEEVYNFIKNR